MAQAERAAIRKGQKDEAIGIGLADGYRALGSHRIVPAVGDLEGSGVYHGRQLSALPTLKKVDRTADEPHGVELKGATAKRWGRDYRHLRCNPVSVGVVTRRTQSPEAALPAAGRPGGDLDVVLRTVGLTKRYGRLLALDDLNLEVRRGQVYGFLGPNGAGKTTTIALILGLIAPTRGHVEMFGLDTRTHLSEALRRTGALLEGQSYYPHLSGRDNLRVWSALSGGATAKRIDEVLELVGLLSRSRDKMRTYSQGMKQRLGLAASLVHDPELVVLDEPTNGLDPAGMREFRQLIRGLTQIGKTVFVSSHLLGEVEQMCDHVGIVKGGHLLTQESITTLRRQGEALEMQVTDPDKAVQVLNDLDWVGGGVKRQDDRLVVEAPRERAAELSRVLAEHQIYLSELRPREGSLEQFFLEVTGDTNTDG